ncbi:MAG: TRAP transporter fused permease subunit [Deltaproteobacteria bacterium]|nr:TRAP transporter fused permease subunit [Deltaproteobacteria bacterium]
MADRVISVLAVALPVGTIAWVLDWFRLGGLIFSSEQFLSGILALALPLVYLAVPGGAGRKRAAQIPWYDAVAAVISFAAATYMAFRVPGLSELITARPTDGMVAGTLMLAFMIEGLRRTAGKSLTVIVILFIVYALVGRWMPGMLQGRPVTAGQLFYYLAWDSTAMLGLPLSIVATVVVVFILFGQVLQKSGGADFFADIAVALMGRYRGGPAKVAIVSSALFGTVSGSAVANVMVDGAITIPMMKRSGYPGYTAAAIEAIASTGGQIVPPVMGAAAFLMAQFLHIPYTKVILVAIVPSILYYVALFAEADLEAARRGISRVEESQIPSAWRVLGSGWFFLLTWAVLLSAMFWLNYLPETSALLTASIIAVVSVVFGFKGKRLRLSDLLDALRATGLGSLDIIMIGAATGMVIGALNISGLAFGLSLALTQVAGGNLFVLLLMSAVLATVLGMGMPTAGVYILMATLVAPALVSSGVSPIAAHMFIFYYGMLSMITPPVALAAFAAASLAGANAMRTGFEATRFGWSAFVVPFLFVYSPTLLMIGDPVEVTIAVVTAIVGVWLVAIGVVGYFARPIGLPRRVAFAASGLLALIPAGAFPGAVWTDIVGVLGGIALVSWEIVWRRRPQSAAAFRPSS